MATGEGIAALQPSFRAAFFGTAAACILALISSLLWWHEPGAIYLCVGGALYLVGSLLVTIVCNGPKNEAFVSVAPADPDCASLLAYVGAVVLALGLLVLGIGLLRK
jgi:uncharacterized membrane protein